MPVLSCSLAGAEPVSTDGTIDLSWEPAGVPADGPDGSDGGAAEAWPDGTGFQLEEVHDGGDPIVLAVGPHRAAALSGRDDGRYRFRVRAVPKGAAPGAWSARLAVRVEHHSLTLALSVLALGAVVFLATAGLVLVGHARARRAAAER